METNQNQEGVFGRTTNFHPRNKGVLMKDKGNSEIEESCILQLIGGLCMRKCFNFWTLLRLVVYN